MCNSLMKNRIVMLYQNESYKIVGAMFEVHNHLGCGFLEKVYQEALEEEFKLQGIPYEREKRLLIQYKGKTLQQEYFADFVCYGKIIVELKAVDEINGVHKAQVINYLKATGYRLGILVNFGEMSLQPIRLLH